MLPSDISTNFRESAVHNLYANVDMNTVDLICIYTVITGYFLFLMSVIPSLRQLVFHAFSHQSGSECQSQINLVAQEVVEC